MGQQPNIEHTEAERPRPVPQPPPPRRWRPTKPGLITSPEETPSGGTFATTGPDAGWALRLLAGADLPDDDPRLRSVLAGLMTARAAALGRAPVLEDLEAGLVLCGYGYGATPEILERRERWLAATAHELRPGATAVAEVDRVLIKSKPEQIRYAQGRSAQRRAPPPSREEA